MAYSDIKNPSEHFNTVLYTGDGTADQSITGVGFQPDFLWIKRRNASERHVLTSTQMVQADGAYKWIDCSDTAGQFAGGTGVASFDSDGFSIKTSDSTWNASGSTYALWSWKANGGTTSSNTDGDVTSTVQVNQDAGFSIITDGAHANTNARTIGHGLGKKPTFIIRFNLTRVENKPVFFQGYGTGYGGMNIDSEGTNHTSTTAIFTDNFTSSVFSVGTDFRINGGYPYITYCFTDVQGFSKSGSYKGNGNVSGPFVYTGFKPAWIIIKANSNYKYWNIYDNKRDPFNAATKRLAPSLQNGEDTQDGIDFLSNGFKIKNSGSTLNESGTTIAYFAIAEHPFVAGGVPTTAR
jgi:hypothetical protein